MHTTQTYPAAEVAPEDPVDRGRLRQPVGRGRFYPLALEAAVHHLVQQVPKELVGVLLLTEYFCAIDRS